MHEEIERVLAPLVGKPLRAVDRAADLVRLHFGGRPHATVDDGDGEVIELAVHVVCPWRLCDADRILAGSGDLFTPADPEEEPESFAWEEPGASWLDVRLAELWPEGANAPVVRAIAVDRFGGFRLSLGDDRTLEVFPNATPTGHVSTEFWRLLRPGQDDAHVVVGTFGIDHEPA